MQKVILCPLLLNAKALAFGNNYKDLSLMITVDLIGISYQILDAVKQRLSEIILKIVF